MLAPDPEKDFLSARQGRTNSKTAHSQQQRQRQADELYTFWFGLRTQFVRWQERLDAVRQDATNVTTGSDVPQRLEDLKQELQMLRKHCLANGITGSTPSARVSVSGGGALWTTNEEQWVVPNILPGADIRMLHAEFSKHFQNWELVKRALVPREKFVFSKYRQELARRKSLGLPLAFSPSSSSASVERHLKIREKQQSHRLIIGNSLQDLSNVTIVVARDGTVSIATNDNRTAPCSYETKFSADSLFLQNLRNCNVRIDKPLHALHLVAIREHTSISTTLPILSAIHITDCHDICIWSVQVQQLRLHESTSIACHVDLVTAGAILEDCREIVFFLPSPRQYNRVLDVKDFNWLREGIPSPNFRIEEVTVASIDNSCEAGEDLVAKDSSGVTSRPSARRDISANTIANAPNGGIETQKLGLCDDRTYHHNAGSSGQNEDLEEHDEDFDDDEL